MTESAPPVAPLVLASTSRYRAALLQRLQLAFETVDPALPEASHPGETSESCAARLAQAKALAVAAQRPDACVIGSDQIADWGGRMLGKPGSTARACEQLQLFSGQRVSFFTAVCVIAADGTIRGALDTTSVVFRQLDSEEIVRYVEREQPLDCAGSFRSEGLGISLFDRIETSDPSALIGLPLIATARLLRAVGYRIP